MRQIPKAPGKKSIPESYFLERKAMPHANHSTALLRSMPSAVQRLAPDSIRGSRFKCSTPDSERTFTFGKSRSADRRRYLHWVFAAKKRFGLSVLDYAVTCNHIHLVVKTLAEMSLPEVCS
jgi:hypothetical protein